jgi:protocatechuate 3,4-dioxygenase beta subunit
LRGHLYCDEHGHYRLETILPGIYPGRTRHIHVKVQAANGPVLTTQLYFPGEMRNARDGIFNPALLVTMERVGERSGAAGAEPAMHASFDFVIATG